MAPAGLTGAGGGSGPARIVRPNLSYIARFCDTPLPSSRPTDIRSIAVVDDKLNMIRVTGTFLASHMRELTGQPVGNIRFDEVKDPSPAFGAYNIFTANTAEEIRSVPRFLREHRIDLIFVDHDMFDLDGPTLIKRARADGFNGIVIGMTAAMIEHKMKGLREAGADAVVDKVEMKVTDFLI